MSVKSYFACGISDTVRASEFCLVSVFFKDHLAPDKAMTSFHVFVVAMWMTSLTYMQAAQFSCLGCLSGCSSRTSVSATAHSHAISMRCCWAALHLGQMKLGERNACSGEAEKKQPSGSEARLHPD
jgi:hypothetical protein